MREIKFRGLCLLAGKMVYGGGVDTQRDTPCIINHGARTFVDAETIGQYAGLKDKNGVDIYEGDIIQFSDRWEWYKRPFLSKSEIDKILTDHDKYPYERRVVKLPESYDWLLSQETQSYWEVIGNEFENSELLK